MCGVGKHVGGRGGGYDNMWGSTMIWKYDDMMWRYYNIVGV